MNQATRTTPSQVDFNLHQMLTIRLIDPSPADVSAVGRQLGLNPVLPGETDHSADITIRFVDRFEPSTSMRYLNIGEMAYTDEAFLILRSKHKTRAKVEIAFDQIGSPCEIRCERGLAAVPLLIAVVNFTALAKGALPIHASAFEYCGKGVLATGWSKGGKTELLLAFMSQGAHYIGDEWVYLGADGQKMFGIPEPIRLWDWHLRQLPMYQERLPRGARSRIQAVKLFLQLTGRVSNRGVGGILSRARPTLEHQLHVDVPPRRLFQQEGGSCSNKLDLVFFVTSHDSPEITVTPVDPLEVASRMLYSLQYEQMPFYSYYLAYQFAFPQRSNPWISSSVELQRQRLAAFLSQHPVFTVAHPYPVDIPALFTAVQPYIDQDIRR